MVPLGFLALFFVWPLVELFRLGLAPDGAPDLGPVVDVVTDPGLRAVLWFTVWQATVSTVLTLALALPGAWVLGRRRFRGRAVFAAVTVVPFVLPTVVVAAAFRALLDGPLDPVLPDVGGVGAILAAHVFFNLAVVIRTVGGAWSRLDPRPEQAAASLGAPPWRVAREVTLPRLAPALWASSALVFLFCATSFGVVLLLGGPGAATIEVEIHRQVLFLLDLPTGAALAVVQLVAVLALVLVQSRLADRSVRGEAPVPPEVALRSPRSRRERAAMRSAIGVTMLITAVPLLVLVERSLRVGDGYGLRWFDELDESRRGSTLFVAPTEAVLNSLVAALIATTLALIVGGLAAFARSGSSELRALDAVLLLPLGTSAVTLGVGMLLAFDTAPFDWRSRWWIVPVAQALVATPFVVRTVQPALASLRRDLHEAAAVLGASPWQVVREVDLPIVGRAFGVAAGFGFAISLGEFGATVFLARGDRPTVPVAIARFLGTPGVANVGQAFALAVILMVMTATAVLVVDRLRVPGQGVL